MPQEKLDENKNINHNVNAAYKSKRCFLNRPLSQVPLGHLYFKLSPPTRAKCSLHDI